VFWYNILRYHVEKCNKTYYVLCCIKTIYYTKLAYLWLTGIFYLRIFESKNFLPNPVCWKTWSCLCIPKIPEIVIWRIRVFTSAPLIMKWYIIQIHKTVFSWACFCHNNKMSTAWSLRVRCLIFQNFSR
jgi:hypothetical protein